MDQKRFWARDYEPEGIQIEGIMYLEGIWAEGLCIYKEFE